MNKSLKVATLFVLLGLTLAWFGFMIANFLGILEGPKYVEPGMYEGGSQALTKGSTYVFLAALVALAGFSGLAYRKTDFAVAQKTPGALPVFRFATVGVVVSLVSLVLFALSAFSASFNMFGTSRALVDQLTGIYVPIILAAGVCVFLLLSVTVYRKSEAVAGTVTSEQKRAKREAALAFIYPIVGTTLALLIGITVYQSNRENPQSWVWVLILAIVGGSIAIGSIYAARTRAHGASQAKPKKIAGTAALSLNFVLVVIFVVVVTFMSFMFGVAAISDLNAYGGWFSKEPVEAITMGWFINSMLPAILILGLVDVTAYIAVRIRSIIATK